MEKIQREVMEKPVVGEDGQQTVHFMPAVHGQQVRFFLGEEVVPQHIGTCVLEKLFGDNISRGDLPQLLVDISRDESNFRIVRSEEMATTTTTKTSSYLQNPSLLERRVQLVHAKKCPHEEMKYNRVVFSQRASTIAACGIVVDKDNKALITKRNRKMRTYPNCWVFPGGQVDSGESLVETALREIEEEVGLNFKEGGKGKVTLISPPKIIILYESVFPTALSLGPPTRSSLVAFYLLRIAESAEEVKLTQSEDEIECSAWIDLDLLAALAGEREFQDEKYQCTHAVDVNNTRVSVESRSLRGIYPNSLGEGIGEAHTNAIKYLASKASFDSQNTQTSHSLCSNL